MNILAIDYGKKRIGLAWCDTAVGVVLPYGVIEIQDSRLKIKELSDLIKKERIQKVIIGLPIGLDGVEKENTKSVREFAEVLQATETVSIELIDERFTSAEADRMGGVASRDEKAAMLILQAYLYRMG